jgi:hypothetical protein
VSGVRTSAVALCVAGLVATASAPAATGLKGKWVASSSGGKIVLKLRGSGASYRGTYAAGGKVSHVSARLASADGARQVTLTFTATHRSTMCGLVSGRLMCAGATGTIVFARG